MRTEPQAPSPADAERILCEIDNLPALHESALSIVNKPSGALDRSTLALLAERDSVLELTGDAASTGPELVQAFGLERAAQILVMRSLMGLFWLDGVHSALSQRRRAFWKHSLATACAAYMIVEKADIQVEPHAAHFMGLFHDVGKAALCTAFPKSYSRIELEMPSSLASSCDMERAVFGTDHAIVGRRIASRWRLPQKIVDCIWLHHTTVDALPPSIAQRCHVQAIALANILAHEQDESSSLRFGDVSSNLVGRALGLSPDDIAEIAVRLPPEIARREQLLGLAGRAETVTPALNYHENLSALSISNAALREQHSRIRRTARLSSIINLFNQRVDLKTATADFCKIAAGTLKDFFQASGIAVFFDRPSIAALNVGLARDNHEAFEIIEAPIDFAASMGAPSSANGWLSPPAGAFLGLIKRYHDWLASGNLQFFPVVSDDQAIGGALIAFAAEHSDLDEHVPAMHSISLAIARAAALVRANEEAMALSEELAGTNRRLANVMTDSLQEKLADSIAATSAGIAHELNNPLSLISGRSQMLLSEVRDSGVRDALEQIVRQAHAASLIISDVMDFAKPPAISPQIIDLADLLRSLRTDLISQGLLTDAQIILNLPSANLKVYFDPDLLRRIFRELINNSLEATLAHTRLLTIKAAFNLAEEQIVLIVADNGRGMRPEVLVRAMVPFYSDRPAGRGRGMGLARVSRWLTAAGGKIRIKSAVGLGTQIELLLPARP